MEDIDKLKSNPTVLVFLGTVIGYALGFFYEWGYLSFYGVGYDYVQIKPLEIVFGAVAALILLFIFDISYGLLASYDHKNPNNRALETIGLLAILSGLIIFLLDGQNTSSHGQRTIFLIAACLYCLILVLVFHDFIWEYVRTRDFRKALTNHYIKLDETRKKDQEKNSPRINVELRLIPKFIKPILLLSFGFLICFWLGHISAGYKNKYVTVIKSNDPVKQIVIRDYGDELILKSFDQKTGKLSSNFSIESPSGITYSNVVLACTNSFLTDKNSVSSVRDACPR